MSQFEYALNSRLKETTKTMPEVRGKQATEDVKKEWMTAYEFYRRAPGDPYDKKNDRTSRITFVAEKMNLTRK